MSHRSIGDSHESPALDRGASVMCPHCGETVDIVLDPASGTEQNYVEDCEVCCRPWQVTVRYQDTGSADVRLEQTQ